MKPEEDDEEAAYDREDDLVRSGVDIPLAKVKTLDFEADKATLSEVTEVKAK